MDPIQAKKKVFHSNMSSPMCTTYILNRFLLNPIAAGASAIIEIPVQLTKGRIADVKCQCESTNYDLYIYPWPVVDKQSIMVTYKSLAINKLLMDFSVERLWTKYSGPEIQHSTHIADIDKSLYLEVINHGPLNTGDIYFELTHEQLE
jgi:hypothetical protein